MMCPLFLLTVSPSGHCKPHRVYCAIREDSNGICVGRSKNRCVAPDVSTGRREDRLEGGAAFAPAGEGGETAAETVDVVGQVG
jgi:hypothetical protein